MYTRAMPKKRPINVRIDEEVLAMADELAQRFNLTRTAVLEAGVRYLVKASVDVRPKP
jgi:antitoxin component of RelBE/YafQ-DinJ toxin-antitoxin module